MTRKNRNGVSVLDVIVTIVVLVALAALLIPSGTRSRPTARRSQCKNNLKQIGLALMNYHDVHRTLPTGWVASGTKDQSSGFGWNFQILPFFDQVPLYRKIRHKLEACRPCESELDSGIDHSVGLALPLRLQPWSGRVPLGPADWDHELPRQLWCWHSVDVFIHRGFDREAATSSIRARDLRSEFQRHNS